MFTFIFTVLFSGLNVSAAADPENNTFIKPTEGTFTSYYGSRSDGFHYGVDIAKSGFVKVVASAPGTVRVSTFGSPQNYNGYGNVIIVTHNLGGVTYETLYAHLDSRDVPVGATVYQGQVLGSMGNTGDSSGQHLHFEVHKGTWNGSKSNAQDPLNYIKTTEGKYQKGNFTYQVGTETIYPISYNGNTDITAKVTSSSATGGEYRVYLQRSINGVWTNVGHIGVPKTGTKTITFTSEYGAAQLYSYTQYRLLLDNVDTTNVSYQVWYE